MWDKIKKYLKSEETKPKRTPKKKSAKEIATDNKEPWVNVIGLEIDEKDPSTGSFDIDYNDYFVIELRKAGYPGKTDEELIDNWFRVVCRNVIMENWEQDQADLTPSKYISRRPLNGGKTEVS